MTSTFETARIADQLERVYRGPSWLGPAVRSLLSAVDENTAQRYRINGAHSVWELALHLTSWLRITRERLTATATRDASDAENWPSPAGSWHETVTGLEDEVNALTDAIRAFLDERLDDLAPASEEQTYYVLLNGSIQHLAYHAGQIAVLTK